VVKIKKLRQRLKERNRNRRRRRSERSKKSWKKLNQQKNRSSLTTTEIFLKLRKLLAITNWKALKITLFQTTSEWMCLKSESICSCLKTSFITRKFGSTSSW
jgi:hypothetical protein